MPVRMAAIKKSTNNKCWGGCGEKGTFLHCQWECKLVQPHGEQCRDSLKYWKQNSHMTQPSHCWAYTPRKPELKEIHVPQCSLKHGLQQVGHGSNQMSISRRMDKEVVVHIRNGILLSYKKKKNTLESVLMRWMKLKPIIQRDVSQKHQYSILTHIYGIQKDGNNDPICKAAKRHRCKEQTFGLCGRR